jgi:hypothetical protein
VTRRHSGGYLQTANGARRSPDEPEGGRATPRANQSPRSGSVSSPNESDGSDPETYEDWIMNIRLIEKLRQYVRERLDAKAYDDAGDEDQRIDPMIVDSERERTSRDASPGPAAKVEKPLYPSLPPIA